eukprot:g24911.t1
MAFLHQWAHREAVDALISAAAIRHEPAARTAAEVAVMLRERGEMKLALELLDRVKDGGPPQAAMAFRSNAMVSELLRQKALCFLKLKDLKMAEAAAREVLTLELGETTGRARSLKILVMVLCAKDSCGVREVRESTLQDLSELQECSFDLMCQKRATLSDCMETCRHLGEAGFQELVVKCLLKLRRRVWESSKQQELRLFGAQMLASRVEEVSRRRSSGPADAAIGRGAEEIAADALSSWIEEARGQKENQPGLGHLLWNLARSLKPQDRDSVEDPDGLLWLQKAQPFLPEAPLWRAMAYCYHALGDASNRRRCLEASARGDEPLVRRLSAEPKLDSSKVAFVLKQLPTLLSPTHLLILQLYLKRLEEEKAPDPQAFEALQMLLEAAEYLGPQCLVEYLDRGKDLACVEEGQWRFAAKLLQALAPLETRPSDTAARCAEAAQALLLVKPKKADPRPVETQNQLCEEALQWIAQGVASGASELTLGQLRAMEAEASGRLGRVSSLPSARAAVAMHPKAAMAFLQSFGPDTEQAWAARREALRLAQQVDRAARVRILQQWLHEKPAEEQRMELLWLVATAWNTGAERLDAGPERLDAREMWMDSNFLNRPRSGYGRRACMVRLKSCSSSRRRCRGRLMLLRPEGRPAAFHWEQQGCTWRDGKLERIFNFDQEQLQRYVSWAGAWVTEKMPNARAMEQCLHQLQTGRVTICPCLMSQDLQILAAAPPRPVASNRLNGQRLDSELSVGGKAVCLLQRAIQHWKNQTAEGQRAYVVLLEEELLQMKGSDGSGFSTKQLRSILRRAVAALSPPRLRAASTEASERHNDWVHVELERRYGAIGAFDYQMDVNTWRSASKSEFMYVEVGSLVSTQAADEAGESALDGFGLEDQGEIPKVNGTASDKVAFQQQCQNYHREKWLTLSQILDIMESSRDGSIEETRQKLRVLDVGTGDGKTLAYLHSRGYPWCNLLGISAEDMRNQKLLEDELPFDPGCPVSSYWVGNVEQLVRSEEGLQMLQGGKFDASLDGKMGLTLVACF